MKRMLKKLTPRHIAVMRRLVVAESPQEIAEELGLHPQTISNWQRDPLFASTLSEMEYQAKTAVLGSEGRMDALKVITHSMKDAALLARETMGDKTVDLNLRMKSAWDILDRGGLKPTDKKLIAHANLTDLILEAAKQRKDAEAPRVVEAGGEQ